MNRRLFPYVCWFLLLGLAHCNDDQAPSRATQATANLMPGEDPTADPTYVEDQTKVKTAPAREISYEPLESFRNTRKEEALPTTEEAATSEPATTEADDEEAEEQDESADEDEAGEDDEAAEDEEEDSADEDDSEGGDENADENSDEAPDNTDDESYSSSNHAIQSLNQLFFAGTFDHEPCPARC